MTRTKTLDEILGDVWDVRDLIERFEELESEREALTDAIDDAKDACEAVFEPDDANPGDANPDAEPAAEELSDAKEALKEWDEGDEGEEFRKIKDILDDLQGNGSDHDWRGSWYPCTMIAESYFEDYAEELVSDIGDLPRDIPAYLVIDWEATADNLKVDYSSIDIDGNTYWYR